VPDLEVGWAAAARAAAHVLVRGQLVDELVIGGDDGHHLERARRLAVGESVTAGDGEGRWRVYRVAAAARGSLTLAAGGDLRVEPTLEPRLTVAFALTKGEKPETVVARLTELGVDRLIVTVTKRSVVRWTGARREGALDRLRRVAREAAMQSRRARLPAIDGPVDLASLAARPGLVVADRDGEQPESVPAPGPEGWLLVVGPEGGLDEEELEALQPAPRLAIGPHVLRAETAAVAATAALTGFRHAGSSTPARGVS
jgi:16S rRNA (uracil1498-N3)-methyltransferase